MTFLGAALSSLAEGGYKPRLTDFRGGKNAKPLYELSRRCNALAITEEPQGALLLSNQVTPVSVRTTSACIYG